MRVNIELQSLTDRNFRGIPYYVKNLLEELVKRNTNAYSGTFFDFQSLRCNAEKINSSISENTKKRIRIYENNVEDYRVFRENSMLGKITGLKTYEFFFGDIADVYHFPHSNSFGYIYPENSIVTVNDIIPIIYRGKGYFTKDAEDRFKYTQKYIKSRKDIRLIAISNSTKNDLCNYLDIDEKRISVVYDAYDSEMCFPEKNIDVLRKYNIHKPYILYVGALDPRKGIDEIVEAYGKIHEKHKDVLLIIVGKEESIFVSSLLNIKNSKVSENIVFTGYVSDEEKRILYSSAEMFLFPSKYEGFGIPVLEAMACGCPVITTNISSLPEVGGDAAIYVETCNADMLAERIEMLLEKDSLKKKCIEKGIEQAKKFSWEKTAIETEKVYGKFM